MQLSPSSVLSGIATEEFCSKCGNKFLLWPDRFPEPSNLCSRCHTMQRLKEDGHAAESDSDREKRAFNWLSLCPDTYRENPTNLIPRETLRRVVEWRMGSRGLLLHGPSQRGKTTSVWRLLFNLYVGTGIRFEAFTESQFAQMLASKRGEGAKFWLDTLIRAPLLFLDDLGHTPSYAKHLDDVLYVIEGRTSWKRPILATTQFTGDELESRAERVGNQKTIAAILNRLRAHCDCISF